jgi:hypothetical protein
MLETLGKPLVISDVTDRRDALLPAPDCLYVALCACCSLIDSDFRRADGWAPRRACRSGPPPDLRLHSPARHPALALWTRAFPAPPPRAMYDLAPLM